MTDYSSLADKPKQFHTLTGYTLEEFDALLLTFADRFEAQMQEYTLAGNPASSGAMSAIATAACPR